MNENEYDNVFKDTPVCLTLSDSESKFYNKKMASKADSWILNHAQYFSPVDDWIDKKDRYLRRKSFAELAIYLYVADYLGDKSVCSYFDPIMARFVNSPEFLSLVKRHPKQLLLYGSAVNYVKLKKSLSKEATDAVSSVLNRKAVWAVERVPHRVLDFWNFLMVYGWDSKVLDATNIIQNSCLVHQPDVIESSLHEAYALTHVLLFYYNFGIKNKNFNGELLENNIENIVIGLVIRYCAEKNFDIVLELLYVAAIHQQLPKWLAQFVFTSFGLGNNINIIRGPSNPNRTELKNREANYIEWAENYHTVLVSASTFRYLAANWDNIDLRVINKMDTLTQNDCSSLHKCGCSFASLAAYKLPLGAYQTKLVLQENNTLGHKFIKHSQDFLKYQRNLDGTYGFWADEEVLFCKNGKNKQDFFDEYISPISTLCDEVVAIDT